MRLYGTLMSLALGLWLASPASAQWQWLTGSGSGPQQSSFFPSIGPIQNQAVDTRDPNTPIATPMMVQSGWSKMMSFFPLGLGTISYKPTPGFSNFPTPNQMPNADYLSAFGFYRARQAKSSKSWWPF